jgi:hypothetical protein
MFIIYNNANFGVPASMASILVHQAGRLFFVCREFLKLVAEQRAALQASARKFLINVLR